MNLIVIDKQPQLQWLSIDEAARALRPRRRDLALGRHRRRHHRARHRPGLCRRHRHHGDRRRRSDPPRAAAAAEDPGGQRGRPDGPASDRRTIRTGCPTRLFRELFTDAVDVVFAFHGFPGAVHQLVHGRPDADRFHVRGFIEQGTTTTPFDMTVKNRVSRFHLVMDAINNAGRTPPEPRPDGWCEVQAGGTAPTSSNTSRTCPRSRIGPCQRS